MGLADKLAKQEKTSSPHLIIEARAGTGKTTTLVEGLKVLRSETPRITPSEQQQIVWDKLLLSEGVSSIAFLAFNKSIAEELKTRVPKGVDASTMHSAGSRIVKRAFPNLRLNEYRTDDLISEELNDDIRNIRRNTPILLSATKRLVSLCKMNLIDASDRDELIELANYYDVDTNDSLLAILDLVPRIMQRSINPTEDGCHDFDDMVWLPIALDLPAVKYDLLLVDEAQDLNRCQQALAKKLGKRLVFCGDPHQAIYGFAGADCESMDRLYDELGGNSGDCERVYLTVTRRCGRKIVEEARTIVPLFHAHESNSEGVVREAQLTNEQGDMTKSYHALVQDGDMIISRTNAILVSQCFKFLRAGRRAQIQGRDIGRGLISLVNKLSHNNPYMSSSEFVGLLSDWTFREIDKENKKRNPSEIKIQAITDKQLCLMTFAENCDRVEALCSRIESVFTDSSDTKGIRLSSIHKAKGLEAPRVFFINTPQSPCPHPMAKSDWERKQERNLLYVGMTRAIDELIWVS